ncbi:helix-turn-helix domain-containing protein [Flavobacterium oreochromis]|uniref:HTH cro/C1-type domain-containing protein n=1 Tax=Flavobacterium columnare TaxID=996 RepID=A0A246GED3_9FLAO|nr:helix-turn-helix domain-containing protein [Flavobacterium oreochromis]OWP79754.1 hypothetical protein BWK62_00530 [Flavobacterium oreochromis]
METLSDRILFLRKNNNLTQIELATKIGVSKSQYIRYETKDIQPPADVLNKLAEFLNTSIDYLINGDKEDKAKELIKSNELLNSFKEIDTLPEEEKNTIIKVIYAYLRDYKTRQAYSKQNT